MCSPTPSRWLAGLLLGVLVHGTAPAQSPTDALAGFEALSRAAENSLRDGERQLADSRYRDVVMNGWLLLGGLDAAEGRWTRRGGLRACLVGRRRAAGGDPGPGARPPPDGAAGRCRHAPVAPVEPEPHRPPGAPPAGPGPGREQAAAAGGAGTGRGGAAGPRRPGVHVPPGLGLPSREERRGRLAPVRRRGEGAAHSRGVGPDWPHLPRCWRIRACPCGARAGVAARPARAPCALLPRHDRDDV